MSKVMPFTWLAPAVDHLVEDAAGGRDVADGDAHLVRHLVADDLRRLGLRLAFCSAARRPGRSRSRRCRCPCSATPSPLIAAITLARSAEFAASASLAVAPARGHADGDDGDVGDDDDGALAVGGERRDLRRSSARARAAAKRRRGGEGRRRSASWAAVSSGNLCAAGRSHSLRDSLRRFHCGAAHCISAPAAFRACSSMVRAGRS